MGIGALGIAHSPPFARAMEATNPLQLDVCPEKWRIRLLTSGWRDYHQLVSRCHAKHQFLFRRERWFGQIGQQLTTYVFRTGVTPKHLLQGFLVAPPHTQLSPMTGRKALEHPGKNPEELGKVRGARGLDHHRSFCQHHGIIDVNSTSPTSVTAFNPAPLLRTNEKPML